MRVDLLVANPIFVGENSIVDGFDNNKFNRTKVSAKIAKSKSQSNSKNLVKFFLTISQSFA